MKERNDWIFLCSSVAVDAINCARSAQWLDELVSEEGLDKDCLEELLIMVSYEKFGSTGPAKKDDGE